MMFALMVIAHPNKASFSHAMAGVAQLELVSRGYDVVCHDLYAERFDPVQTVVESSNTTSQDSLVEQHCQELGKADLVLVFHPNWWSQPPAILKGWIDRVFRLDTAYGYAPGQGFDGVPVGLLRARQALIFNTSNTPSDREVSVSGDPLESLWKTSVFGLCGVDTVNRRMFAPVAGSTAEQRSAWLAEVETIVANAA